ncbi:MAG: glycosyltransferase [Bacteroidales bacterium]|nr:glycosyltransferase [Bacteroidales bacterium]
MDISIVIVSFNVRYFLESCLYSVYRAMEGIDGEVIVVDNASVDGTLPMLSKKFPEITLISNKENVGFSKACNQGIAIASGRYVLLLNPDTLIEETTLIKSIRFLDKHPDAGALGVKMIDGKGNFLPESKRALPTPMVAFYKIFGLSSLFPHSPTFNRYYLGHLDENVTHSVEVLTGAFMMLRKEVLDKTGGLDEDYFMYGEDVDLSYRITQAGYRNYYYPETTIVHYKGESTKKGSLNYVILFYKAMLIFAGKHFSRQRAGLISLLIRPAIYIRAALSAIRRVWSFLAWPLIDMTLLYIGYLFLVPFWEQFKFQTPSYYPPEFRNYIVPAYIIVWILSVWIAGGYRKPVRLWYVVRGLLLGMVAILVIYALLPVQLRFSRALILLGTVWGILAGLGARWLFSLFPGDFFTLAAKQHKNVLIISYEKEFYRISKFLKQLDIHATVAGYVPPEDKGSKGPVLGSPDLLPAIVKIHRIQEIIFSAVDTRTNHIIRTMNHLSEVPVEFKVALPEGSPIVGSSSVERPGELYLIELNAVSQLRNRLKKRVLDISLASLFVVLSPMMLLILRSRKNFIRNCLKVLSGSKTWVGYCRAETTITEDLPILPESVLCPVNFSETADLDLEVLKSINQTYARNYHLTFDLKIVFRNIKRLGN